MSKTTLKDYAEVISAIINHKAGLKFPQHLVNGKVDEAHVLSQLDHVETGYLEYNASNTGFSLQSFEQSVGRALESLDGSVLIDIIKECRRFSPFSPHICFMLDELFKKAGLGGLLVLDLTESILPQYLIDDIPSTVGIQAHARLSKNEALKKAVTSFVLLQKSPTVLQTRQRHRRTFESILLKHPDIQQTIIQNTLGQQWLEALESSPKQGRYAQLHDTLTTLTKKPDEDKAKNKAGTKKMAEAMKEMHKGTQPNPVNETPVDKITDKDFSRPGPSPAGSNPIHLKETTNMKTPLIRFNGLNHFLGPIFNHADDAAAEIEILVAMLSSPQPASETEDKIRAILSFIHRSNHQYEIINCLVGKNKQHLTPVQLGEIIEEVVRTQVLSWENKPTSRYADPASKPRNTMSISQNEPAELKNAWLKSSLESIMKENKTKEDFLGMWTGESPYIQFPGTGRILGGTPAHGESEFEELEILYTIIRSSNDSRGIPPMLKAIVFIQHSEYQEAIAKHFLGHHNSDKMTPTDRGLHMVSALEFHIHYWSGDRGLTVQQQLPELFIDDDVLNILEIVKRARTPDSKIKLGCGDLNCCDCNPGLGLQPAPTSLLKDKIRELVEQHGIKMRKEKVDVTIPVTKPKSRSTEETNKLIDDIRSVLAIIGSQNFPDLVRESNERTMKVMREIEEKRRPAKQPKPVDQKEAEMEKGITALVEAQLKIFLPGMNTILPKGLDMGLVEKLMRAELTERNRKSFNVPKQTSYKLNSIEQIFSVGDRVIKCTYSDGLLSIKYVPKKLPSEWTEADHYNAIAGIDFNTIAEAFIDAKGVYDVLSQIHDCYKSEDSSQKVIDLVKRSGGKFW